MAVILTFQEESETELQPTLEVCALESNQIFIRINYDKDDLSEVRAIRLDKATSIRLAKELRKQISFLED
jgi:hypothetical protein